MDVLPTALAVALILGLAEGPVLARGQQAGRVYRIGVLDDSSAAAASARIESFRKGLRDLGHIEGQSVKIESRFAEGKEAALSTLATELAGLKPDVLVSSTGSGLAALHNATTAIPIVAAGADAGTRDITPQNLARPGGNVTGARVASLIALPYANAEFDAVWCANALEYLSDEEVSTAVTEFRRVVPPAG